LKVRLYPTDTGTMSSAVYEIPAALRNASPRTASTTRTRPARLAVPTKAYWYALSILTIAVGAYMSVHEATTGASLSWGGLALPMVMVMTMCAFLPGGHERKKKAPTTEEKFAALAESMRAE